MALASVPVPVLHLPLAFPSPASSPLTAWSTVKLHLPSLIPHFSSVAYRQRSRSDEQGNEDMDDDEGDEMGSRERDKGGGEAEDIGARGAVARTGPLPSGAYSHLTHVKIYATCRLRRVWLSEGVPGTVTSVPWEFELYGGRTTTDDRSGRQSADPRRGTLAV